MRGNDYQHYTEVFNGDIPDTTGFLFIGINDTAKLLVLMHTVYSLFIRKQLANPVLQGL